jgi:hypothetical protein
MEMKTFEPAYGSGETISATTSSSRVALTNAQFTESIVLTNTGSDFAYVRPGTSTVVATAADYCLLPGQQVSVTRNDGVTHVAALAGSSSTSVHVIPGQGF